MGKGTGMGLSVVHGIVKTCKGGLTVKSKKGEGTAFDIYFHAGVDIERNNKCNVTEEAQKTIGN
jgi:signal transduction histidine kinase